MDSKKLKILFVSSEVAGLVKTGGLADVAKSLPQALIEKGHDVRVVMPFYSTIKNKESAQWLKNCQLPSFEGKSPAIDYQIYQMYSGNVPVYAIGCDHYYDRPEIYAENNEGYFDNGARFAFLSCAALDCAKQMDFQPDIVHCNDWHAGLVPLLLKNRYWDDTFFNQAKSIITIHNAVFQGIYPSDQIDLIPEIYTKYLVQIEEGYGQVNFLKAGVLYADTINAVSPNYANELLSHDGGHGMERIFNLRREDFFGVVNGCDYGDWNPEIDGNIPKKYTADLESMLEGKAVCKASLQTELNLPVRDVPVFGMVCRLTGQKGLHLLTPVLDRFLLNDVQVVIEGTGDPGLAAQLNEIAKRNPHKLRFIDVYDNRLAHIIEAASDLFMMPSLFEPCGLNQLYSMAYGTLPIVRAVGGLRDTVVDYDWDRTNATGFVFTYADPMDFLATLQRSLILYLQNNDEFRRVQLQGMARKFYWSDAADEYLKLYLR